MNSIKKKDEKVICAFMIADPDKNGATEYPLGFQKSMNWSPSPRNMKNDKDRFRYMLPSLKQKLGETKDSYEKQLIEKKKNKIIKKAEDEKIKEIESKADEYFNKKTCTLM